MNNNKTPKTIPNYGPNWRRRLGRPLKTLSEEFERGLSRPNSWRMMWRKLRWWWWWWQWWWYRDCVTTSSFPNHYSHVILKLTPRKLVNSMVNFIK
jgi:hypothetical protein